MHKVKNWYNKQCRIQNAIKRQTRAQERAARWRENMRARYTRVCRKPAAARYDREARAARQECEPQPIRCCAARCCHDSENDAAACRSNANNVINCNNAHVYRNNQGCTTGHGYQLGQLQPSTQVQSGQQQPQRHGSIVKRGSNPTGTKNPQRNATTCGARNVTSNNRNPTSGRRRSTTGSTRKRNTITSVRNNAVNC